MTTSMSIPNILFLTITLTIVTDALVISLRSCQSVVLSWKSEHFNHLMSEKPRFKTQPIRLPHGQISAVLLLYLLPHSVID